MPKRILVSVAVVLFLGAALIGCKTDSEPTWTIWTGSMPYASYSANGSTLNDGQAARGELTNAEYNSIISDTPSQYKYTWNEDEIYNWFTDHGFGASQARTQTTWLIGVNHGILFSRTGITVYFILK